MTAVNEIMKSRRSGHGWSTNPLEMSFGGAVGQGGSPEWWETAGKEGTP